MQELVHVCTAACQDITRAENGLARLYKLQKIMVAPSVANGSSVGGGKQRPLWEPAAAKATEIPVMKWPLSSHDLATMKISAPFIVSGFDLSRDGMKPGQPMLQAVLNFRTKFDDWRRNNNKTRGGRPLKEEAFATELKTKFADVLKMPGGEDGLIELGSEQAAINDLATAMKLQHFARCPGTEHFSSEVEKYATLRLTTEGTRVVVMTSLLDIAKFLVATKEVESIEKVSVARALQTVEGMKEESLAKYIGAGMPIFQATIGPHDLLYTPVGYAVGCQVHKQMVTGFVSSVALKCNIGDAAIAETFEWLEKSATADGKADASTRAATSKKLFDTAN